MRRLGADGPEVSVVGLGANNFGWRIGLEESRAVVDAALDAGVSLIDTADVYGATESERILGEILAGRRDRFVVVTKFGHPVPGGPDLPRSSRAYLRWAVEGSLERLRTDVIDVYMLHRPDGVTPVGETVEALGELVREGQGALRRRVERRRRAGRRGRRRGARRRHPARLCREPLQPHPARGGGGRRPGLRAPRPRPAALLPARERPPDGEVPAWRGPAGRLALRRQPVGVAGGAVAHRGSVRRGRGARGVRRRARDLAARPRDRRPRRDARRRQRHRRGNDAGPGPGERPGGGSGSPPPTTWRVRSERSRSAASTRRTRR